MLEDTAGGTRWKRVPQAVAARRALSREPVADFGAQPHTVGRGQGGRGRRCGLARGAGLPHRRAQPPQRRRRDRRRRRGRRRRSASSRSRRAPTPSSGRRWRRWGRASGAESARAAALYLALRGIEPPCRFDVLAMEAGRRAGGSPWSRTRSGSSKGSWESSPWRANALAVDTVGPLRSRRQGCRLALTPPLPPTILRGRAGIAQG